MSSKNNIATYCGFIAIIGRPNVGKSTLLNQLLGQKVSITSCKPNTTRHQIIGIHTEGPYQAIYIDTPGIYITGKHRINRLMNCSAISSIHNVELVIFVVAGTRWTLDDTIIANKLHEFKCNVVLTINKVDLVIDKKKLLPHIHYLSHKVSFYDVVPICAETGMNVKIISNIVHQSLPKAKHQFPSDCITDGSQQFMSSEIIREKLMRFLGKELPYSISVEIDSFVVNHKGHYNISGLIMVERAVQKKIVIGNNGHRIKIISSQSRKSMESVFNNKVYLKLWVKVRSRQTNQECNLL